jgi:S-phase kinase-associated protein 1
MSDIPEIELTLLTDNSTVTLSRGAAQLSKFLRTFLEDGQAGPFPVPNVTQPVMKTIIVYLEEYKAGDKPFSDLKKPLPGPDLEAAGFNQFDRILTANWSMEFAKQVLSAANFLDIESLLELAAARVGTIIKSTPIAKLMELVGVTEFTPEWEEEVRKKNPWCKAIQKNNN